MSTITTTTIKSGNCQFNTTSAKSFRTILAKWHNATFEIADELLQKSDRVKALRTLIASNESMLEKLAKGETLITKKTSSELTAEIEAFNAKIDAENKAMSEYRKAQTSRLEGAENLVSKTLYESYTSQDKTLYTDATMISCAKV